VYYEQRLDSGTSGVFLLNSDGIDIKTDQTETDSQYIEYNTICRVFDFYFWVGQVQAYVSRQYADVAVIPAMMPCRNFCFHQCKYS